MMKVRWGKDIQARVERQGLKPWDCLVLLIPTGKKLSSDQEAELCQALKPFFAGTPFLIQEHVPMEIPVCDVDTLAMENVSTHPRALVAWLHQWRGLWKHRGASEVSA